MTLDPQDPIWPFFEQRQIETDYSEPPETWLFDYPLTTRHVTRDSVTAFIGTVDPLWGRHRPLCEVHHAENGCLLFDPYGDAFVYDPLPPADRPPSVTVTTDPEENRVRDDAR